MGAPAVRPARVEEARAVAEILYLSSADMYDRYAGGRDSALRVLTAAVGRAGNSASAEVTWVAERGGALAAAMTAFPVSEGSGRGRRLLLLTLRLLPPWRWPATISLYRLDAAPAPPANALYVDALATAPGARRAGAATALLELAGRRARALGLTYVALDTSAGNAAARALYEGAGFRATDSRPPARALPGFVAYMKEL